MVLLCVNRKPKLLLPVTDGFAPVEPPHEMSPAEDAELNRPLEGTPQVWPPRETYEPVDGPTDGPQVDGDMCEDETPAPLEAGEAEVEERGESSSHEQMLEEEESESAEPDDPSTTGASQTHTHENTGGREHNTELEIPSSPEVCPTVRSVELAPGVTVTQACVGHICLGVPLGTEQYVRDAALAIIRSHEQRLRAVIHLANYEGPEVMQDRVNIARQTAMHMMRFSRVGPELLLIPPANRVGGGCCSEETGRSTSRSAFVYRWWVCSIPTSL